MLSNGASLMAWHDPLRTTRRKQELIMVEDSLLHGMEVHHDLSSREVCWLLEAHIQDIVEK